MLFLAIYWTILLVMSFALGTMLTGFLGIKNLKVGDKFIISVWSGITILSILLLLLSNFTNLSLSHASWLILILFSCLLVKNIRSNLISEFVNVFRCLDKKIILSYVLLLISISWFGIVAITWRDVGNYHWGIIKWLSKFGSVKGLALIISAFGLTSSWYTLPAIVNLSIFESRVGSTAGGFALLMLILHFLICASRIFSRDGKTSGPGDWFVFFSSLILFPIIIRWRIFVSPTPDLPVIIFGCLVPWSIIVLDQNKECKDNIINNKQVPLTLSLGAFTFKVTALPLLIVSYFFCIFSSRINLKKVIFSGFVAIIFLLPLIITNIRVSGYPFYPLDLMYLEGPSSLAPDFVSHLMSDITEFARWTGSTPDGNNIWNWLSVWTLQNKMAALLLLFSIISLVFILKHNFYNKTGWSRWPLLLGVAGTVFFIVLAPLLRFGLGYLVILPGIYIALYHKIVMKYIKKLFQKTVNNYSQPIVFLSFSILLSIGIITACFIWNNFSNFSRNIQPAIDKGLFPNPSFTKKLLVPSNILNWARVEVKSPRAYKVFPMKYVRKHSNGITYFVPVLDNIIRTGECWDSELPCVFENNYLLNVRLKNPAQGFAEGFIREE